MPTTGGFINGLKGGSIAKQYQVKSAKRGSLRLKREWVVGRLKS